MLRATGITYARAGSPSLASDGSATPKGAGDTSSDHKKTPVALSKRGGNATRDLGVTVTPLDRTPDGAVLIPLIAKDGSIRGYTVVDATDAAWVSQWTWRLHITRSKQYALRNERPGNGRLLAIRLHRVLMGLAPEDKREVDHLDRDGLNNRRANLRIVSHAENIQNCRSRQGSTSEFRGVSRDRTKRKWAAQLRMSPRTIHLGYFDDELDAAGLALTARLEFLPGAVD